MEMRRRNKGIVVAVDFGTTFSGVAWAEITHPDACYIINQWPQTSSESVEGMTSDKVPSEVAYKYEPDPVCVWGFQIPHSMPRLQWMKLGLVLDTKAGISSGLAFTYRDSRRAEVPHHTSLHVVVTDYLRSLHDHTIKILKNKIGDALETMSLEFVITVTAMWPGKAKMETLSCAEEAGFGETSKIRIISEPEAAAIHTLRASNLRGLEVGDTIVLCDAGGGKVDLITFSILELEPKMRLKEEAPGKGSLCGGTFLNRRFEKFLEDRLSLLPGCGRDTLDEALQRFENVAKRSFGGNPNDDFIFPVLGLADNHEVGIRRGRLRMTGREMKEIFHPVLEAVLQLVKDQIRTSKKEVKSVFLVGGFGQNSYLRNYLRESIQDIEVLVPGVDGHSGFNVAVDSRVARKNYGIIIRTKFVRGLHDEKKKYWYDFDGEYKIDIMKWFIRKGDEIKENKAIKTHWRQVRLVDDGNFDSIQTTLYEFDTEAGESPPMYINRQIKQHACLSPRLNSILKERIPVVEGKDGNKYYQVEYQIHAAYFSAHCEYTLWFGGKDHGTVKVDYA
ncbi:Hsp70 protein [Aspergillus sclerotialis]|uniref:Hsp70 protein n=1 Tax=Aspergillus sclerotialis TaxID=2070753 RepID=A0A3A2Z902_9EURO|nr:Hsp70 protein [Aspergillus sclerotialis]